LTVVAQIILSANYPTCRSQSQKAKVPPTQLQDGRKYQIGRTHSESSNRAL